MEGRCGGIVGYREIDEQKKEEYEYEEEVYGEE